MGIMSPVSASILVRRFGRWKNDGRTTEERRKSGGNFKNNQVICYGQNNS